VRGAEKVNLNLYDSGKALVQGKDSELKGVLDAWKQERTPSRSKKSSSGDYRNNGGQKSSSGGQRAPVVSGVSRVGTDEAGKGDYFGPLVVAGVRVLDEAAEAALRGIGVRDSKLLGTGQAVSMAERIMQALGPENVSVVSLEPPEFERRRSKAGDNVNRLLGEINVEILSGLSDGVDGFVVDEFAKKARSYIEPGVPSGVELEVRPRAEDDAAVAAASIVARARYLEEMDELSRWAGLTLPRGSTHVKGAAHRIYSERGRRGLEQVAKISFSITKSIGAV
jgi:ribonuclease HIII